MSDLRLSTARLRTGAIHSVPLAGAILLLPVCAQNGNGGAASNYGDAGLTAPDSPQGDGSAEGWSETGSLTPEASPPEGGGRDGGQGPEGGLEAEAGGSADAASDETAPINCPSGALKAGDTARTLLVGSTSRSYVLHVPSAYVGTGPVPLVVDFHGLGGSGAQESTSSPYPAQTDPDGVVMAFPTGLSGPSGVAWNLGSCCVANVDDEAFAKAVVADVESVACIDPKRVYAVGFSIGGGMTHVLGCKAADVFAAIAPAAADLTVENPCAPSRPIPVIFFRGTADTNVPYGGGSVSPIPTMPLTSIGAQPTFQKWASLDACTGSPSAEDANGCSTYSNCGAGVTVTLCTKQGGGHEPGNASVAWPVLKRYSMP